MVNNLTQLVEKTFARRKFQQKLTNYCRFHPKIWHPDIAISRDPGSGGRLIAQKLAKKLHWQLYDKNILKQLAQETDIPTHIIPYIDEHPRSRFTDIFHAAFNPNYVSDLTYIQTLRQLIITAGKNEDVVFLGRGANFILPANKILRVRITASLSTRITNTIKHEKLTRQQATKRVIQVTKERHQFIRQYFAQEPNDPSHYDIVLNTDQLSLDQAVNIIITAFQQKFPHHPLNLSKITS